MSKSLSKEAHNASAANCSSAGASCPSTTANLGLPAAWASSGHVKQPNTSRRGSFLEADWINLGPLGVEHLSEVARGE